MKPYERMMIYALEGAVRSGGKAIREYDEYIRSRKLNLSTDFFTTLSVLIDAKIRNNRYLPADYVRVLRELQEYANSKKANQDQGQAS